jgi:DNA repair ATPase RecN
MTIKSLEGANWENYPYFSLDFSPGVNVIIGKSHSGKSTLIRSLNWVLENDPKGTPFFPHNVKNPQTEVSITFDTNEYITRSRNNTVNEYTMSGKDKPFTALRTDVPEEVKALSNITDVNIQVQKDVHFFLTESAGKRAKKLNEVANLEEMDKATVIINGMLSTANASMKVWNKELKGLEQEKKELSWVPEAIEDDSVLSSMEKQIAEQERDINTMGGILDAISTLEDRLAYLPPISAILPVQELLDFDDQIYEIESRSEDIKKLRESLLVLTEQEKGYTLPAPSELSKFEAITTALHSIEEQEQSYRQTLDYFAKCHKVLDHKQAEVVRLEKALDDMWKELEICPLCGSEVK